MRLLEPPRVILRLPTPDDNLGDIPDEVRPRTNQDDWVLREEVRLLIFNKEDVLVGCIGLLRINWSTREFEIAYWCKEAYRGMGYITEAVRTILNHKPPMKNVKIKCHVDNHASKKIPKRLGFALEGVVKDMEVYSLMLAY